jgi:hypothetical protein
MLLTAKVRLAPQIAPVLCVLLLMGSSPVAQTPQTQSPPPQKAQDEVVRVYTELVQTDVMVLDKQGKFVDGLKKEDFELRIDGQVRAIEAFEKIIAGSN